MSHDNSADSARRILERYARAWRGEEEFALHGEQSLAFWVSGAGGGEFYIVVSDVPPARLHDGIPARYDVGFELDMVTLRALDSGALNALTAMGQARASDPIPLRPKLPPSFQWTAESRAVLLPFLFHFWNRSWPESMFFGEGTTRKVHGGNATVFFYDSGLRSSWYQLKSGMHMNGDPADQTNVFSSFLIVTRGRFQARLGGHERTLVEGEAVFIPIGMAHEFWAQDGQYGEFILLMFGDKA